MLSTTELLAIAAQLAILTYNIGVLIYMLPVPVRRIKHLAPLLMEDAIYAAALTTLFGVILYASDYVASYSKYSLDQVLNIVQGELENVFNHYLTAKLYQASISIIPYVSGSILLPFILPYLLVFTIDVSASIAAMMVIIIVMRLKAELAALGVALYALPMRLGKSAGASILAFVLVANAMMHYLPYWIDYIKTTVVNAFMTSYYEVKEGKDYGDLGRNVHYYPFWGIVKDAYGHRAKYPVVELTNSTHKLVYMGDVNGVYIAFEPQPARGIYGLSVTYLGVDIAQGVMTRVRIPQDLDITYENSIAPFRLDITALSNVVFTEPQTVIYGIGCIFDARTAATPYSRVPNSYFEVYRYRLSCIPLAEEMKLLVAVPGICRPLTPLNVTGAEKERAYVERFDWYDTEVLVVFYELRLPENVTANKVSFVVDYACPKGFRPVKPFENHEEEVVKRNYEDPIRFMAAGFAYATSIFSYLSIMGLIVRDVARFLGAVSTTVIVRTRG